MKQVDDLVGISEDIGLPLSGYRVLELGSFVAAPFAARMFADFGAEVIKVERPKVGDELRQWRRTRGETSMLFRTLARNKKSVELDLRSTSGREAIKELVKSTDVLIENFRPGTLEKWGLGPDELISINPDLIFVRISGYGQTGPYRDRAGFGSAAESFAGLRFLTGDPDRPAGRAAAPIGDTVSGLYGAFGALMLLLEKANGRFENRSLQERKQKQLVDVALYEGVHSLLESLVPDFDAYGTIRQRMGSSLPGVVPAGAYPTADGLEVIIGGNSNSVFRRLMEAIGRQDLADDKSLADAKTRGAREEELNGAIESWTSSLPLSDVLDALGEAGVPAAPIYDAASLAEDPHYIDRQMVQPMPVRVEDDIETVRFPGIVPKIGGHDGKIKWIGPEIGEHTVEILGGVAGYSQEQINEITASSQLEEAAR